MPSGESEAALRHQAFSPIALESAVLANRTCENHLSAFLSNVVTAQGEPSKRYSGIRHVSTIERYRRVAPSGIILRSRSLVWREISAIVSYECNEDAAIHTFELMIVVQDYATSPCHLSCNPPMQSRIWFVW